MVIATRTKGESTANTAITVSSPTGANRRRLLFVTVKYSGAPTHAGVTITLNSGEGAAWDTLLATGAANAQSTIYLPDNGELYLLSNDTIDVVAPAGGGTLTAAVAIYSQEG